MQSVEELSRGHQQAAGTPGQVVARHFRDPRDVQLIGRLCTVLFAVAVLLLVSLAGNAYQHYEKPNLVVMDKDSGRVLVMNDKEYGETENVKLGPDGITEQDKKYLAGEFVKAIFQVDPATRVRDVERALKMMVPEQAPRFAEYLTKERVLAREREQSKQALWSPQDVTIDPRDPWTVRIIGEQEASLNVPNAGMQTQKKQFAVTLKLAADPSRRADRNLRSGVLVAKVDWKEIGAGTEVPLQ